MKNNNYDDEESYSFEIMERMRREEEQNRIGYTNSLGINVGSLNSNSNPMYKIKKGVWDLSD